jgi:uncharacterized protein YqjF (DUF2071 family)
MRQVWNDLLFAHWPIPLETMRALVPPSLPVDTFDGSAWIGIVPFRMSGVRPRGVPPIPGISAFPELNVRTYVTLEDKPGVYFFSLDAANPLAVVAARWLFHLPYFTAQMQCEWRGGWVEYNSERTHPQAAPACLRMRYRPTGDALDVAPGSLADFLTARFCLYAVDQREQVTRLEIDHARWPLQPSEAEFDINTMTQQIDLRLPDVSPLLHFSRHIEMVGWLPERVIP